MPAAGPLRSPDSPEGGPPTPPKRGRRLSSIENVRAGLAFVWRGVEAGTLDLSKARVLTYTGSVMLMALEKGALEDRIRALEEQGKVSRP